MKKIYLFFIPLLLSFTLISPKALTDQQAFDYIFTTYTFPQNVLENLINGIDPNYFINNYYIIDVAHIYAPDVYNVYFIDKATAAIRVVSASFQPGSVQWKYTDLTSFGYNFQHQYLGIHQTNSNGVFGNVSFYNTNKLDGTTGTIMFTNLPLTYKVDENTYMVFNNRPIPNDYFPIDHPGRIVGLLSGDQVDSIVDTNLTSILDDFDIDLLFENLEDVLEQIYGFIESAFLSLNDVITYITGSLNNVVSFITANITIISIISMVYLALPSILRDLFTLALSTSVVFIMLRRFI